MDTAIRCPLQTRKKVLLEVKLAGTLIMNLPASRTVRDNIYCLSHSVCGVCYSNLSWLRHLGKLNVKFISQRVNLTRVILSSYLFLIYLMFLNYISLCISFPWLLITIFNNATLLILWLLYFYPTEDKSRNLFFYSETF